MALQGNLRDFSVTEILQLLGTQKKTGCLMLEWNTERALLSILDGRIVSTREPGMRSDDPLLAFLTKIHRLSVEQRRGLQSIHKESGRDFEELLVTGRYIEPEELRGYLERQILNDLTRLVRWDNGGYRFDPKVRFDGAPLVKLSMEGVLIEAARRVDEQRRFVTRFKDPYELMSVQDLPDPDEPLSEEEKELFGIIDGQHTVAEIVELAPLSEYEAYEAIHRMLENGWIVGSGRRDPGITLMPSPVRVVKAPPPKISLGHEILVGAMVVALAVGFHFGARSLHAHTMRRLPDADVFAAAGRRDLTLALELYRRERGAYPQTLEVLVEEQWLGRDQIAVTGYQTRYQVAADGTTYQLELQPEL